MEKQIKKLTRELQLEYGLFILVSFFIFLSYEMGWMQEGGYADNPTAQYLLETGGILLALVLVPLALKMFSLVIKKKIQKVALLEAIVLYRRWSGIRLIVFAVAVVFNLFVYFLTLNNTGGLCALICITASLFCLPTEKKVKDELDIINKLEI